MTACTAQLGASIEPIALNSFRFESACGLLKMITSFASAASFQPSFGLTELEKSAANVFEPETSRIDPKPGKTRQSIARGYIISSVRLYFFDGAFKGVTM